MEKINHTDWIFIIDIAWGDRWHIYRRLQELKIPCQCSTGKPLTVTVDTPTAAIQVWSVTRTQSLGFALPSLRDATRTAIGRSQLVNWLDRCFTLQAVGVASRNENRNGSELLYD
jgi:hypothetical protein